MELTVRIHYLETARKEVKGDGEQGGDFFGEGDLRILTHEIMSPNGPTMVSFGKALFNKTLNSNQIKL
jgi:hypothetical protein